MTIQTRPARKADITELSHALGRAFYDDPVSVWIMPDDKARAAHLRKFFATVTRHHHLAGGGAEVACDGPTSAQQRSGIRRAGGNSRRANN